MYQAITPCNTKPAPIISEGQALRASSKTTAAYADENTVSRGMQQPGRRHKQRVCTRWFMHGSVLAMVLFKKPWSPYEVQSRIDAHLNAGLDNLSRELQESLGNRATPSGYPSQPTQRPVERLRAGAGGPSCRDHKPSSRSRNGRTVRIVTCESPSKGLAADGLFGDFHQTLGQCAGFWKHGLKEAFIPMR
ncbi:unnamed protein product, partial [Pleuronectes platessa]